MSGMFEADEEPDDDFELPLNPALLNVDGDLPGAALSLEAQSGLPFSLIREMTFERTQKARTGASLFP